LNNIEGRLVDMQKSMDDIQNELNDLSGSIRKLDTIKTAEYRSEQEFRQNHDKYQNWSLNEQKGLTEITLPEGSCEMLEEQLNELMNSSSMELKSLVNRRKELSDDLDRTNREWEKLQKIIPDIQTLPIWTESKEEKLEIDAKMATIEKDKANENYHSIEKDVVRSDERLKQAKKRLVEVNLVEPLPEEDIHGNYFERIQNLAQEERELERKIKEFNSLLQQIEGNKKRIIDAGINPNQIKPASFFLVQDDGKEQLDGLLQTLRVGTKEANARKEDFRYRYDKARNEHAAKSELIRNLFEGLAAMLERATDSYEPFYFLYERMQEHVGILSQHINRLKAQLEGLDKSRADVVEHCFMHGQRIAEELHRIEQYSQVRLDGRSSLTTMLKVDLKLDSESEARIRMERYIENSIELMKEEARAGKNNHQTRLSIEKLIRSRELLNQYINKTRIPVQVFKIDLNMVNSRLKVWEDAVRENSGGEKFVVYFSVLTALMAYTRFTEQAALVVNNEEPVKDAHHVLIMDNPFGPISSQHLLKPLFDIAKKYQTQLICLTDLKQSSILNNFHLVYMLRVRKGAASQDEYLKFEEYKRDERIQGNDEELEKAFYRKSDYKQMQLDQ